MPFANGLFTPDDFLAIENVLYTPRESELKHRQIFSLNTSYPSYALEVGYDYYQRQGSAKIIAAGGSAKDIPFVGEKGNRITQNVYTITSGIRFAKAERLAAAAKSALGKGPTLNLPTTRISSARRYCFEMENKLVFAGDANHGIKGVMHDDFYGTDKGTKEFVAQGATGTGAAEKRLWSNKTAQEILIDVQRPLEVIEADDLFEAKVLVLPPAQYNNLRKPFSTTNDSRTLLSWLNSEGMFFSQIVKSREMKAGNNGDTVDTFMVFDNDPEIMELILIEDIMMEDPIFDLVGTSEQAVTLKTAGMMVRHPAALYVGRGI
jgi:hypothetical protein